MKLKFAAALAALAASSAVMAANPASINVNATLEVSGDDPAYSFFQVETRKVDATKSFKDFYNFHLDSLSDVSFSVVSDALYNTAGNVLLKGVAFDSITLTSPELFAGTGSIALNGMQASLAFTNLLAGDYTVTLKGHAIGKTGGSYYGDLGVTGAVPEPESMALAFAGLGVIGLLARRRKSN